MPRSSSSQTPGPSVPCGATIPYTLPSSLIALARNSGYAHVTATLELGSTALTRPSNPSGLTTAASGCTPWRLPAESTTVSGLRSEEHTSELQSQSNLVCRLLLEK